MPRTHAKIKTAIWSDPDFLRLPMPPQWLYHVLLEQPNLTLCGVAPLTITRWASFSTDASDPVVSKALVTLERRRFVVVDRRTEEVWVRSFVRHDGVLSSPNLVRGMAKDYQRIHSERIRQGFVEGFPEPFPEPQAKGFEEGFVEGLPDPFREHLSRARARRLPTPDSRLPDVHKTPSDLHARRDTGESLSDEHRRALGSARIGRRA